MPRRVNLVIPATCCNGDCDEPGITAQQITIGREKLWGTLCVKCSPAGNFALNGKAWDKIMAAHEAQKQIR